MRRRIRGIKGIMRGRRFRRCSLKHGVCWRLKHSKINEGRRTRFTYERFFHKVHLPLSPTSYLVVKKMRDVDSWDGPNGSVKFCTAVRWMYGFNGLYRRPKKFRKRNGFIMYVYQNFIKLFHILLYTPEDGVTRVFKGGGWE